jgi:DNA-binding LacI/PurR family transcriptional regulator
MAIDLKNPMPLYQQIAEEIKAKIRSGALKVGDAIGSHSELTAQYQVSVITVKKALSDLIKEGYLYSRVGKGTFVARKSVATSLSRQKTIGLVLRDLTNPFFSLIAHGAEKKADALGYNLFLSSSIGRIDKEETLISRFETMGVDGMIIASLSQTYRATDEIKRLHQSGFPYLMVSYIHESDFWYVGTDHEHGAYLATEHLLNFDYKHIGYVTGGKQNLLSKLRQKGYERALNDYGRRFKKDLIFEIDDKKNRFDAGYEVGKKIARLTKKPDALFIYSDMVALGVMKGLLDAGLQIPRDIALVGFDDIERAQYADVPLTTVHQPTEEIGAKAVEILIERIEGKTPSVKTILPSSLVVRESCGQKRRKSVA